MVGNHEITVSVSKKPITGSPVTIRVIPQKGLICKFGRKGSGEGDLDDAWGVMVTRDGNIRVCDRNNERLQTFTLNGKYQSTTTFSNISTTVSPDWSTVSEDGTIFTSDGTVGQVIGHDEFGRVLRCFGKGVISYCFGIAMSPMDGRVYVVDNKGHCIHIYDQDGNYCKSFGCEGQGQGQLCKPVGIAIDGEGKAFVSDRHNHRIQVFDAEGQYLYSFGSEGSGDNQMRYPSGIALDCDGNVYVCDKGNNRVMKYESDGKFIGRIDSEDNTVDDPRSICVTDDRPLGYVVTNSKGKNIQVFSQ
ncbi:tripartite motif-containing protein 2-like [Ptychodera flava]|uniref:tripartite motif-containing protein 2-like n=1 Tax=Ptychodera flava TaxID=63121 RepID=UPI00396A8995